MTDKVGGAIAATEPQPSPSTVIELTLGSGRKAGLVVPVDMTNREALDLVGFIAEGLADELERRRGTPRPTLFVARGSVPRQ